MRNLKVRVRVRRVSTVAAAVVVGVAVMAVGIPSAGAEPGDLDSSFGRCGVRPWSVPSASFSQLAATVVQTDGKLLQVTKNTDASLSVTRLVPSGAGVDRSYGTNGTARVAVPGLTAVTGGVLAPNGQLVVSGVADRDTRLVRLLASGRPDQSFANGGVLSLDRRPPKGIVVQANNRIIFWGGPVQPPLTRYLANGTFDASYTPPLTFNDGDVHAAALATNGDLVVVAGLLTLTAFRFRPNGTEDMSFTSSFMFPVVGAQATFFQPQHMLALPGGQFLIVGHVSVVYPGGAGASVVGVAQLQATGDPDPGYGGAGFANFLLPGVAWISAATPDAEGRLLLAGMLTIVEPVTPLLLARVTATGALDQTFGSFGTVLTDAGYGPDATGISVRGPWIVVGVSQHARVDLPTIPSLYRFRTDSTKLGAGYVLGADAALHPFRFSGDSPPPCVLDGPVLGGLARGVTTVKNRGGLVLDAYGGLHRFSIGLRRAPAVPTGGPYWPGVDIARGVAALANGKGGYVLDGYGGIHRYRSGSSPLPPPIVNGPYWPGWDIARGIALMPDGKSGYVLDGLGGLHPFAAVGNPLPPPATNLPPLLGDAFRGIAILPDGSGGYASLEGGAVRTFAIGAHDQPQMPCPCPPLPRPGQAPTFRGVTFVAPRGSLG
jgi:uncharacterized delta-60 repeat protein